MYANTTGSFNNAFGIGSLQVNSIGYSNSGYGNSSLFNNTSGIYNTGIGDAALAANTTGSYNTAVGGDTYGWLTTGNNNTAIGYFASNDYLSGSINNSTAIGSNTKVTANNATAIGFGAIANNTNSIQLGNSSVTQIFAGTGTTAKFITGGLQVTGGSLNTGNVLTSDNFGNATWQQLPASWLLNGNSGTIDGINFIGTTDNVPLNFRVNNGVAGRIDQIDYNTFYGYLAGNTNTGKHNTFNGYSAGLNNTSGEYNSFFGGYAGAENTSGYQNSAFGHQALYFNNSGTHNTAVGYQALMYNTDGIVNQAFGISALLLNEQGNYNVAVGYGSLSSNINGISNTGLGNQSNVSSGNLQNATSIGANSLVNASNKIRLGNASVTVVEGPVSYTVSDGRFKKNIKEEDVKGLPFINRLRPVVYNFDTKQFQHFLTRNMPDSLQKKYFTGQDFNPSTNIRQSGFIAQEVEAAAKESGYDFNGVHVPENADDNYSLSYSQFVVPLVKSVQELSKQNEDLKKEIAELRALIMDKKSVEGSVTISETDAKLFQNAPNPFSQTTTIRYSIPVSSRTASIAIVSSAGVVIKEFQLIGKNNQPVNISGGQMAAGSYTYSLYIDGKLIDTKKMVLTK